MSDATIGCCVGNMSVYRESAPSACSGVFYEVEFRWTKGSTAFVGEVVKTIVCYGHMDQFRALGVRDEYRFEIVSVRELDQPIGLEKE